MKGRFVRLAEQGRPTVNLKVDGAAIEALQGDTLIVALLTQGSALRQSSWPDFASRTIPCERSMRKAS